MGSDTPIRLSIAITAVPERQQYLEQLLAWLGPCDPAPEIFMDEERRGPWWNTRRAWEATPSWATHRLCLQEDVRPCLEFISTVERVLAIRPESFISFIMAVPKTRDYMAAGARFMPYLGAYGQAPCLPAAWIPEFLGWVDGIDFDLLPDAFFIKARLPERQPHDDGLLIQWLYEEGRPACATVPSLVLHVGRADSTVGHETHALEGPPLLVKTVTDGQVVAQPGWYWIGEGKSGLEIDWEQDDALDRTGD